jgi:hypothetical protein
MENGCVNDNIKVWHLVVVFVLFELAMLRSSVFGKVVTQCCVEYTVGRESGPE